MKGLFYGLLIGVGPLLLTTAVPVLRPVGLDFYDTGETVHFE